MVDIREYTISIRLIYVSWSMGGIFALLNIVCLSGKRSGHNDESFPESGNGGYLLYANNIRLIYVSWSMGGILALLSMVFY